ncbi:MULTISPECIES: hypothetical protein [unclassified Sphingopyxis]|uniref:hypothetical protein n=1 Tax=unclassified Sphingopyxis TaxID=2614943 RepID=UPI0024AE4B3B|nr:MULTISPECIES: hypothetical protein [unclassified Sphingopyxis]
MIEDLANVAWREACVQRGGNVAFAELVPRPCLHRKTPQRFKPRIRQRKRNIAEKDPFDARQKTLGFQTPRAVPRRHFDDFPIGAGERPAGCAYRATVARSGSETGRAGRVLYNRGHRLLSEGRSNFDADRDASRHSHRPMDRSTVAGFRDHGATVHDRAVS